MQVELRRGLPRVPGGEPWPPACTVDVAGAPVEDAAPVVTPAADATQTAEVPLRRGLPRVPGGEPWPPAGTVRVAVPAASAAAAAEAADVADVAEPAHTVEVPLRRGLPRVEGGDPWPPAGTVRVAAPEPEAEPEPQPETAAPAATVVDDAVAKTAPAPKPKPAPQPAPAPATAGEPEGVARQWLPWAIGALLLLAAAVFGARWFVGTEAGADFIARYDGVQPLPDNAPTGLPGWLNWAHFFNMFLMALIIKTGIDVRREKRPAAYWQPKNGGKKISVTLWLHQLLDVTWVALGVVFYVLLFTTGQWMRIVPTSWDAIPHAVSAGLQYLSLDWPTENPWVHYNALQELSYFVTVFIASPLAIASGFRMSSMWPKSWTAVPVSWARAVHFPTMIYFVAFIVVHVFLVLTTGLRGNFNAMFASREDATSWIGVVLFLVAAGVTALGWRFARASVVAPVAGKTGKVSKR
ncbi:MULTISPECIES: cytochrome b/b6 domain-containing protein [unclassified Corynebacterium]|uniref:cytochrome b/b6 domain-containing protein n=1 Tax=unclassified Corynebacterium TaxID=2624378 RepID=UPI001EF65557|nr:MULTISPECIES: cytochrome b/b6 domain-containing protein [unclassified Corynebacterium]MCG7290238.1 cytochrome b/b6 domain-containing protein [Corynebacterium sp. ACRPZ]MCG7294254.1 cytochrome b/b6 domain-containing protein [Corynebacterium sp. ACRPY]